MATPQLTPWNLALAQAQTAIMNAQAYNTQQSGTYTSNSWTIAPINSWAIWINGGVAWAWVIARWGVNWSAWTVWQSILINV